MGLIATRSLAGPSDGSSAGRRGELELHRTTRVGGRSNGELTIGAKSRQATVSRCHRVIPSIRPTSRPRTIRLDGLGNRQLRRCGEIDALRVLRTNGVVLVRRQRNGHQDGDDRDDDHQFDKGKALLVLHDVSPKAVGGKDTCLGTSGPVSFPERGLCAA